MPGISRLINYLRSVEQEMPRTSDEGRGIWRGILSGRGEFNSQPVSSRPFNGPLSNLQMRQFVAMVQSEIPRYQVTYTTRYAGRGERISQTVIVSDEEFERMANTVNIEVEVMRRFAISLGGSIAQRHLDPAIGRIEIRDMTLTAERRISSTRINAEMFYYFAERERIRDTPRPARSESRPRDTMVVTGTGSPRNWGTYTSVDGSRQNLPRAPYFRGDWAEGITYNEGDLIHRNGSVYQSIVLHTSDVISGPVNDNYWRAIGEVDAPPTNFTTAKEKKKKSVRVTGRLIAIHTEDE